MSANLIRLTQYLHLFKPLFYANFSSDYQESLTPEDVHHALNHPDIDPLCGLLVTKLLQKKMTTEIAP
jgi:hypothetical protein